MSIVNKLLKKVFGDKSQKEIAAVKPIVEEINKVYATLASLSNDQLRAKTEELKGEIKAYVAEEEKEIQALKEEAANLAPEKIHEKEKIFDRIDEITEQVDKKLEEVLEKILPTAFAVVKETARRFKENESIEVTASQFDRDYAINNDHVTIEGDKAIWQNSWDAAGSEITWDMLHYDVQLIGGIALHKGSVAEMQTGEGKTLVATLPVYLNALAGKGVHLVTVNDYLARRDSEWMGPLFEFHGLSVSCIDNFQPNSEERRTAYKADITYGTNNEFGFDYLRDNMAIDPDSLVQRKHHYAIVDEVDSVLIDDARTPLIISGPTPKGDQQQFEELKPKIKRLVDAQKSLVTKILSDAKKKLSSLGTDNPDKEEIKEGSFLLFRAYRGLPKNKALIKFLSEQGVKAAMQKTENFYLQEQGKNMPEVDKELYFTIDEKNNSIELTEKGLDLISGSDDPSFFIMPDVGSLLAEIDKNESLPEDERLKKKDEIVQDYGVKSERIHTVNQLLKAYTLFEKDVEYVVMDGKVKIVDEQTGRIMEGRRYSDGLHQAIEAKESVKVEAATQTYATITLQNYFRMYHKLAGMTGTAETEAGELWDIYKLDVTIIPTNKPIARKDHEDKVFKTKREKYNAIIDEIVDLQEQGRPVLVGTTSVEVSELLSKMLTIRKIRHNVLNAKLHQKEADIVAEAGKAGTVTIATNMAGRGTDIKLSKEVKEAGGLAIIGSEKHDSRRVDRQLRGRSGRQGDPGSSQFYLSLEDDLMRLFNSDRVAKIMDRLGLEEGEVIQHSMITRSIERAQKKVEENNFGIRKKALEYDDVLNAQRDVIYKRRKHALFGDRLKLDIANMFFETSENLIANFYDTKDIEGLDLEVLRIFATDSGINVDDFTKPQPELAEQLFLKVYKHYQDNAKQVANMTFPVVKDVFETQGEKFTNIMVPFTDGKKGIQLPCPLKKAYETEGKDVVDTLEKRITLSIIDDEWKEHLRELDELRQSVQGAVYEQKDPLLIYKFESFELFKAMLDRINVEVVSFLTRARIPVNQQAQASNAPLRAPKQPKTVEQRAPSYANVGDGGNAQAIANSAPRPKAQPLIADEKIGRNDPCPCGSGKKYKQCHGK
ncbi:preprotein translocase subunit SecA [Luteibaculum oceani]|uniref:Protein translocase subunit SecA n=1 Tax=Luteibaculum oceani TaxID=1294296 RepID=A0A5C6UQV4_9FLAO|nr:preprotein translocase subunit SecA [Luteibaculum oceani]TXC75587.1 preprotein translocase subunit SecA [Luteibaculum oceani]